MGAAHHNIVIDVQIKPQLENINRVVGDLRKGLEEGSTKIDLTKGLGKSLSALISRFQTDFSKIQSLTPNNILKPEDSRQFQALGENLIHSYKQIQQIISDINTKSVLDVKKLFPEAFDSRVEELQDKLNKFVGAATKISELEAKLAVYENKLQTLNNTTPISDLTAKFNDAQKAANDAALAVENLKKAMASGFGANLAKDNSLTKNIAEAKKKIQEATKNLENLQKRARNINPQGVTKKGSTFAIGGRNIREWQAEKKSGNQQADGAIAVLQAYRQQNEVLKEQTEILTQNNLLKSASAKQPEDWTKEETAAVAKSLQQTQQLADANKAAETSAREAARAQKELNETETRKIKLETNIQETGVEINSLKQQIESISKAEGLTTLSQKFKALGINFQPQMLKNAQGVQQLKTQLDSIDTTAFDALKVKLKQIAPELAQAIEQIEAGMRGAKIETENLFSATAQLDQLKSRLTYFFGIANTLQLFKRTVQKALNTVKELDAVMTETAVVTDFTVGDMWEKLPEYSVEATKLGASIKDLYSATTLYYQQGLQTEAAMSVGIETMKMARIAGMEAAEATEAMTAALRGFNMEVNETNATRVNDVYSELAAITAADTEQIATAMSKTASIASSANMEFETTAALLAQIVETTQEAPETAGTAMKTIIARFTEVKQLFSEGMLTGEDEEGEEININKIDTALKTVGISLKDFLNGSKGIDDIFLELASKWDSLDLATQRYIATMAAGSRQQSRFIAMMSNYERTMELVDAANNSAGASQNQFDKTLESMEAKIQKLSNAWNEFLMGLANNEILKAGIDLLTSLLSSINKVTSSLSSGGGLVKSLLTLTTILGALKGGKMLLGGGLNWIGTQMGINQGSRGSFAQQIFGGSRKEGEKAGQQAGTGFVAGVTRAIQQGKNGVTAGIRGFFGQATHSLNDAMIAQTKEGNWNADNTQVVRQVYQTEGIDAAKNKFIELGGSVDNANKMVAQFSFDLQNVGFAALAAGGAIKLFASMAEKAGREKLSEVLDKISIGFTALGSVLMILGPIFNSVGGIAIKAGGKIAIAGWTSQLAWWWIFAIITAVALLTFGIVKLAQAAKKASLEGRMEAAAEATKDAQAAAENAKTAYDDLLGAQESYNELQSTLEGLTKGTNEWKQALIEANAQVLQLLSTYPELAKYIGRGKDGQLTIDDEGWNEVIDSQNKSYQNSQRNVASSQIAEERLKQEKAVLDLRRNFQSHKSYIGEDGNWVMSEGDQISRESSYDTSFAYEADTMTRMLDAYKSMPEELFKIEDPNADLTLDSSYSDALQEIAAQSQYTAEELYGMKDALIAYDEAMLSTTNQMEGQAKAALTAGASQKTNDYEYGDDIIESFAKTMTTKTYETREQKKASEVYSKDGSAESETNQTFKDLAEEYKVTNEMVGDDLEDLKTLYAAMAGIAKEEIPEGIAKDKKRLAQEIGKMQASKDQVDNMEAFREKMEQLQLQDQKELASLISGNTSNLTFGELQQIQGKNVSDYASIMGYASTEEMAKEIGYEELSLQELNSEDQRAYLDKKIVSGEIAEETLAQYQNENGTINYELLAQSLGTQKVSAELQLEIDTEQTKVQIEEAYNTAIGDLSSKTELSEEDLGAMFADSSVGVIQGISQQVVGMSDDAAKDYINAWNDTIEGSNLGEAQKKQLENYLSSVNWSSMTEAVEAMDYMQSLGLNQNIIKSYWEAATNGANTYITSLQEALSLTERMQKKMQKVDDIEKALTEGTASYEQMTELTEAGVDISDFQLTPEGWKATTEQIEEATKKLREYNAEQARAMADQQKEKFQEAQDIWSNSQDTAQIKQLTQNEDGTLVAGEVETAQQARGIVSSLGLQGYDAQNETYEAYIARIQAAYDAYIDLLNNGEDITLILEKAAAMAEAAKYTADENAAQGGSDESVRMSMQNEATEAGLDPDEVTKYADALREIYSLERQMADRIAIDNAKMNQGIKELADNWDAWGRVLNSENKDTLEYSTTLTNVRNTMKKLLNINKDLSEDFLTNEKNLKLMKKASEGNAEAIKTLRKEATKDIIVQMDLDPDATEQVTSAVNSILDSAEYDDLQIGASLETTSFYNALQGLLDAGAITTEEMNNILEGIGFEPTVEMETVTVQSTNIADQTAQVLGPNGEVRTVKLSNDMTVGGTIQVPRIGNSKFKGAPKATINPGNKPSGGGGGGGGSKEKWENPYDEFYNVVEDINEELRTREKLERRYQALLDKTSTKASDLVKNTQDQLKSLEKEKEMREGLLEGRKRQMSDIENEYSDLLQYAWYNEEDGTIEIDWEKINALDGSENEELTSRIEEYVGKLEEQQELIESEEEELESIEETVREIRDQGKDEYFDLENQIKEALIGERQQEIDKLSAINESINDTNSRLIDAMQSSIDKYRQDRENERTEEELSDKQRRLAYLQQDTSGANALEIMQLQEEIDQGMEDYTDQLIDQKINELQEQNDEAAEQREKQIAIAEAQLKKWEESGEIWNNVYELMGKGMDDDGIIPGSELQNLLKEAANFEGMSELQKMDWLENLENNVAQAIQWLMVGNSSKSLLSTGQIKKGQSITFTTKDGKTVTGTVQKDGSIKTDTGEVYKDVYRGHDGKTFYTTEDYISPNKKEETKKPEEKNDPPKKEIKVGGKINAKGAKIYGYIGGEGYTQYFKDDPIYKVLEEKNGYLKVRWHKRTSGVTGWFKKSDVKAYKQGGLADFTGPAWLDGTKSKPEYILNAEQTKSFFELVDVLGSLKSGTSQSSQITGDSIYDVDINVESIGSDYDVEKLATTIKRMINDDARYRNNNAINLQR